MDAGEFQFRPLRRAKQAMAPEDCIAVLKEARRGVLSMIGDGGWPYGIPLDHFYDDADGHLYFHGAKAGHHIDSIRRCDKVSYCVTDGGTKAADGWWLVFRSVVVFGRIREIADEAKTVRICRELGRRFAGGEAYAEEAIRKHLHAVLCLELAPEHIGGKIVAER